MGLMHCRDCSIPLGFFQMSRLSPQCRQPSNNVKCYLAVNSGSFVGKKKGEILEDLVNGTGGLQAAKRVGPLKYPFSSSCAAC